MRVQISQARSDPPSSRRCARPVPSCPSELLVLNILEIFVLFADFVRISQRHPEEPLTARLECNDMLARGEDHPSERHHALLTDCLANDRKRLLADFPIRHDVVGAV